MSTQDRYTDGDLLRMLQIVVADYNRQPTQREVLSDDRLPTHHTYRNRFGTLAAALKLAGMGRVPRVKSPTHDAIAECFRTSGLDLVGEWAPIGSIVVDFVIKRGQTTYLIDLVEIGKYVGQDTTNSVLRTRQAIADAYRGDAIYIQTTGTLDAVGHCKDIIDRHMSDVE